MNPQALLAEFDMEMDTTRRVLARLPDEHLGWRPHEKSWTLGQLAKHVANIPHWGTMTMAMDTLSLDDVPPETAPESAQEVRDFFEANVSACRAALEAASGDDWATMWRMTMGGEEIMAMPRAVVVRSFIMNHLIHHRAQLGVYYRLLDIPVPQMYGPTADEQ